MSKRFTDTGLWTKVWFMELTPAEKLAWFYVKDQCDNVGVWAPNYRLAEFQIGTQLDWDKFSDKCNGNVAIMDDGKWWLVDFCEYQHPDLAANPDGGKSNALKSYVRDLKAHGLYDDFLDGISCPSDALLMPFACPSDGPKAKQGKGKGKGKGKGEIVLHEKFAVPLNESRYDSLCLEYGKPMVDTAIQDRLDWESANGKTPAKDYAAAAANWLKKAKEFGKLPEPNDGLKPYKASAR